MICAVAHPQSLSSAALSMVATAALPFLAVGCAVLADRRWRRARVRR